MYNSDTEVIFPSRVIGTLRSLHGDEWRSVIDRVRSAESAPAERYAFVLMMARICGCAGCNADSFRAMRGCTQCARLAAKRFRGGDHEFTEQFRQVVKEVEAYMLKLQSGMLEQPKPAPVSADDTEDEDLDLEGEEPDDDEPGDDD